MWCNVGGGGDDGVRSSIGGAMVLVGLVMVVVGGNADGGVGGGDVCVSSGDVSTQGWGGCSDIFIHT